MRLFKMSQNHTSGIAPFSSIDMDTLKEKYRVTLRNERKYNRVNITPNQ
jgi:hypothetical protein